MVIPARQTIFCILGYQVIRKQLLVAGAAPGQEQAWLQHQTLAQPADWPVAAFRCHEYPPKCIPFEDTSEAAWLAAPSCNCFSWLTCTSHALQGALLLLAGGCVGVEPGREKGRPDVLC